MKNRKKSRRPSRLDRIEGKCDIILSELLIIRQRLNYQDNIDRSIDRLHHAARRMRQQCERERDNARRMLDFKRFDE